MIIKFDHIVVCVGLVVAVACIVTAIFKSPFDYNHKEKAEYIKCLEAEIKETREMR